METGAWQRPPPGPPAMATGEGGVVSQDDRTMGLLVHLSALAGVIIPFGTVLGPLVVWLVKKDGSAFVDDQGKQALNFQLTLLIASLVLGMFVFAMVFMAIFLIGIPFMMLGIIAIMVLMIVAYVFAVIGGIKANEGTWYRYPFQFAFLK